MMTCITGVFEFSSRKDFRLVATMLKSSSHNLLITFNESPSAHSTLINKPNSSASFKEIWRLRKENWLLPKFIGLEHAGNDKLFNWLFLSWCWLMLARRFCVHNTGLKVDAAREIDCNYDVKWLFYLLFVLSSQPCWCAQVKKKKGSYVNYNNSVESVL